MPLVAATRLAIRRQLIVAQFHRRASQIKHRSVKCIKVVY